ncbi:hypothetical protein ACU4HD_20960 [Cupriavidus basilensis]
MREDRLRRARVAAQRLGLVDVLVNHPAIELTLPGLLACTVPMRPRFYSIASSPAVSPAAATITVGTVLSAALSGRGPFRGVVPPGCRDPRRAPWWAAAVEPVRPVRPDPDPARPMILVGPGTGIAPFRGFLEERAAQMAAGQAVAASRLYYGCRHPEHDWLYRDDVARWQAGGVVQAHAAYSTAGAPDQRYVQHLLWRDRETVWAMLQDGATIYVCGDGRLMAPAVRRTRSKSQRSRAA